MRMKRLQMKHKEENTTVLCNSMTKFQRLSMKTPKTFMKFFMSILTSILIGPKTKKCLNLEMKKRQSKKSRDFTIFGSILTLGENFSMKKSTT